MAQKIEKLVPGREGKVESIRRLTEKQRRFVEAYLGEANGNATEAAVIAGYEGSRKNVRIIASRNLALPNVRIAIDERTKDDGSIASREERQAFLSRVMRTEHSKMGDRLKAAELLSRMHGDFIEKHEVDMKVSRLEKKAEIANFLDQLSARASAGAIGPGTPIVQVIDATAESVAEADGIKEGAKVAGKSE